MKTRRVSSAARAVFAAFDAGISSFVPGVRSCPAGGCDSMLMAGRVACVTERLHEKAYPRHRLVAFFSNRCVRRLRADSKPARFTRTEYAARTIRATHRCEGERRSASRDRAVPPGARRDGARQARACDRGA